MLGQDMRLWGGSPGQDRATGAGRGHGEKFWRGGHRGRTKAQGKRPGQPCRVQAPVAARDGDTPYPRFPPPPPPPPSPPSSGSGAGSRWVNERLPRPPRALGLPAALPCAPGAGCHRRPPAPGRRRRGRGAPGPPPPPPHPPPPPSAGAAAAAAGSWPDRAAPRAAISARGGAGLMPATPPTPPRTGRTRPFLCLTTPRCARNHAHSSARPRPRRGKPRPGAGPAWGAGDDAGDSAGGGTGRGGHRGVSPPQGSPWG